MRHLAELTEARDMDLQREASSCYLLAGVDLLMKRS